ncbi:MAG: hypothetical protein QOG00_3715 [Pyrinomonadaceae bacterium]|nr:hypothetical protein [Pyrinomonadaceae bacterium]
MNKFPFFRIEDETSETYISLAQIVSFTVNIDVRNSDVHNVTIQTAAQTQHHITREEFLKLLRAWQDYTDGLPRP